MNETVIQEGDPSDSMFFINYGKVFMIVKKHSCFLEQLGEKNTFG